MEISPDSPEEAHLRRTTAAVEAALRTEAGNGIRLRNPRFRLARSDPWFAISEPELVGLLPGVGHGAGFTGTSGPEAPVLLPLGRSATGQVYGAPVEPAQGRHLAVLGETGMGKSSCLVSIARKACGLGGILLFDPLGETADSFVGGLSDGQRAGLVRVAPLEPGSAINALEGIGPSVADPVLSDRRLNDLVHAFQRVRSGRYAGPAFWGPRLEEMLSRALMAAASLPGGTLVEAHALLATGGRTRQVVPPEAAEAVRALSERIRERPEDAEGARRLLYEVVRSPVLRRMLCERSPQFHPRQLVEPGQVAVISGDASAVGESVARYLLAVYLALVWSELLARPAPSKTFVVMDESQWFSHESLAEMLRLARRKNVHVVLATQSIASLPEDVAHAVWTNVSDFLAFRGSPEEARELARMTAQVSVENLLALPRGHAVALLGKGNCVQWLRASGRPPSEEEASRGADGAPRPAPDGESVLSWIRSHARDTPNGQRVRVVLSRLRREIDPDGRRVRAAGAALARAGAILATERSAEGSVWVLDPGRLPPAREAPSVGPAGEPSEVPQPS